VRSHPVARGRRGVLDWNLGAPGSGGSPFLAIRLRLLGYRLFIRAFSGGVVDLTEASMDRGNRIRLLPPVCSWAVFFFFISFLDRGARANSNEIWGFPRLIWGFLPRPGAFRLLFALFPTEAGKIF
jgi:hypothetical protein